MRHSKLTYYLLAILCMIATSCVTDGVMDDYPDNAPALIKGGKVNLILSFPSSGSTRGVTGTEESLEAENHIHDIDIYTFVDNKFKEKVQYVLISGKDGDNSRTVEGNLSESYPSNKGMEFVVIANMNIPNNKKVNMTPNTSSKEDLYNQLVFNSEDYSWPTYTPMWGVSTIGKITSGTFNIGDVELQRAVAKVSVTVNDGKGLPNFRITKITLNNYNNQGYCANSGTNGKVAIPRTATPSLITSSDTFIGTEGNNFQNQFYIPEHQNIGATDDRKVYLTIEAIVGNGIQKTYKVWFKEDNVDYDVLRNYIYVFNITNVKTESESSLDYEVKAWESKEVDIPSFN